MNTKKIFSIVTVICMFCASAYAQSTPVKWDYSAKKISDKIYGVHITAKIDQPWHIYSQTSPDGGALPTKISFTKNPLIVIDDKPKEVGKMINKYEEVFGVNVKYYNNTVDFVQIVKLKNNVNTSVSGTIEFMACNDKQCLPPTTVPFSVSLK